jgi:hypothetical protein
MMDRETFQKKILTISSESDFNACAIELFHFQYKNNAVYRRYVEALGLAVTSITHYTEIPFLPISLFKTQRVSSVGEDVFESSPRSLVFKSSGTTQHDRSSHYIGDSLWYEQVTRHVFEHFYGDLTDYVIIAYLPSYYENKQSSLLYMVDYFMRESQSVLSGYYDFTTVDIEKLIQDCIASGKKPWIIGVTYALLDWIDTYPTLVDSSVILVETGGMKGRREEIVRSELHERLKSALGLPRIYSEYGMCEMLSQGYCFENEEFKSVPWVRFLLREVNDPFATIKQGNGLIKVIDLANIDSCAFIETQDLGSIGLSKGLKILGRLDNSDLRGCNLLYQN